MVEEILRGGDLMAEEKPESVIEQIKLRIKDHEERLKKLEETLLTEEEEEW